MKYILLIALIFLSFSFAYSQEAQQKPLSQAEYVKLLYNLQNSDKRKEELISTIRKRGIAFTLTDGIRGLTRSKSANNIELLRTLEESERRRQDPAGAQLPSQKETDEILAKTRANTLAAVEEMPDFVVKQLISRGIGYAGTNNFRSLDKLVVAVSYLSSGKEEYKVLSINGVEQRNDAPKGSYEESGGTTSTGEFVTVLATVFKRESETKFEAIDTSLIRGRKAIVFGFETARDKAKYGLVSVGYTAASTTAGMKGKIWIDRDEFRVLRLESAATEIPADFPIRAASQLVDYDWASIADLKYLLPLSSEVRLTSRQDRELIETRNRILFKEYKKFGSEVRVLDDDEIPEDKPQP